jgi:PAS domain-containing protein
VDEIFHIINQETRRPSIVPVQKTLEHGTIQGLANHTVLIARDGSECAIADSCAPIRDGNGKVVGVVLVFRDVTEEYAVQRALRESENRFRKMFEESSIGVVTVSGDLHFLKTNPTFQKMLGYSGEELKSLTFKDLTRPPM